MHPQHARVCVFGGGGSCSWSIYSPPHHLVAQLFMPVFLCVKGPIAPIHYLRQLLSQAGVAVAMNECLSSTCAQAGLLAVCLIPASPDRQAAHIRAEKHALNACMLSVCLLLVGIALFIESRLCSAGGTGEHLRAAIISWGKAFV